MKVDFNHAIVYVSDLERAKRFYVDVLGFKLLEEAPGFYVRVQSSGSQSTLALHKREPGATSIRLYFESEQLDALCEKLKGQSIRLDKEPEDMPWGWRHAYLRDPDGHELSLYFAGAKRLRRSQPRPTAGPKRRQAPRRRP
ncbi:MAG: VOC family protein [Gammaproteobacteria bacterium]